MERRGVLRVLAAGTLSAGLPVRVDARVLKPGNRVSLRCLGRGTGRARCIDGRTENGSVGLAPALTPKFSGTKWRVRAVRAGVVALECQGRVSGPRWLDGRTATGTVGLAPTTDPPYTGTRWDVKIYPVITDQPPGRAIRRGDRRSGSGAGRRGSSRRAGW
jgi:hypothetical protein